MLASGYEGGINSFDINVVKTTNSLNIDTTFSNNGYFTFDSSQAPLNEVGGNKEYADNVLVDSGNLYISGSRDWGSDSYILKLQESDGAIIDAISGILLKPTLGKLLYEMIISILQVIQFLLHFLDGQK